MLAKNSQAPRSSREHALSLTFFASKLAPTSVLAQAPSALPSSLYPTTYPQTHPQQLWASAPCSQIKSRKSVTYSNLRVLS
ncbi:hypothetical protein C7A12_25965 [Pseudomonas fluorescens]|nr:hypothetical protein C7A12_25965 [Pseudomonas fluorescens]PRW73077.1 hypothetical protein C7A13_26255 [Pseudomonas fluorescens]